MCQLLRNSISEKKLQNNPGVNEGKLSPQWNIDHQNKEDMILMPQYQSIVLAV